jgi:Protein of unknown function (DUF1510).
MRNHRGNGASSRTEQRRNKADHVLNWMIGVISLLILAIGCIILIVVFNQSSQNPSQTAESPSQSQSSGSSQQSQSGSSSSSESQSSSSASSSQQVSNDSTSSAASSAADSSHQTSYDIGTADWNAQVQAISDATGIAAGNMTIHWLGNGGSSNSSLARISPKSAQGSVYVVHLTYSNGKWQADNVQKPAQ